MCFGRKALFSNTTLILDTTFIRASRVPTYPLIYLLTYFDTWAFCKLNHDKLYMPNHIELIIQR